MTIQDPAASLFDDFDVAGMKLRNRIVMAPMTRARSPELIASEMTATYYAQRSGAGLIVTEGIPVSEEAIGYIAVPGISSTKQVAGWRLATDAVHAEGGRIFAQLWHVGRLSHRSLQPGGAAPVSASATVARDTNVFGFRDDGTVGFVPAATPRALSTDEMPRVVADFRAAAVNAIDAGFDGIEIHGATGYLFEQFLNPNVNDRTDRYGGSIASRAQLLTETVDAIAGAIGPSRTAVRLSPFSELFDLPAYPEAEKTYLYLADALSGHRLAYLHLHDVGWNTGVPSLSDRFLEEFRSRFAGPVILAGGVTAERAADCLRQRLSDLAAFGRPYIANPDLVERLRHDWPLAEAHHDTFYGGGAPGYIDYPPYETVSIA
jgi:2,4-dienoyl-CoA reductase-like NADH-dependent reductase (Old Yellow Enzyme family)